MGKWKRGSTPTAKIVYKQGCISLHSKFIDFVDKYKLYFLAHIMDNILSSHILLHAVDLLCQQLL